MVAEIPERHNQMGLMRPTQLGQGTGLKSADEVFDFFDCIKHPGFHIPDFMLTMSCNAEQLLKFARVVNQAATVGIVHHAPAIEHDCARRQR